MEKKKNVGKILIACGCSALGAGVLACGIVMAINSNEFNSSMKKMLEVNTPAKIFNTSDISDQTTGTVYGTLSAANIAAYSDVNDIIYAKGDHAWVNVKLIKAMRPAYYSILQYKGGANEGKYFAFISYVDPSDPDFEIGTYAPTATSPHYILDHSAYDKSTIIVSHKGWEVEGIHYYW